MVSKPALSIPATMCWPKTPAAPVTTARRCILGFSFVFSTVCSEATRAQCRRRESRFLPEYNCAEYSVRTGGWSQWVAHAFSQVANTQRGTQHRPVFHFCGMLVSEPHTYAQVRTV